MTLDYFTLNDLITALFIFLGAVIYSSVGHGGASSYIAIMSFMGTPTQIIKPIGLSLNIIVSSIASYRFVKHRFLNSSVLIPVVIGSIPAAFIGGLINLPSGLFRLLLGFVLLVAGLQLIFNFFHQRDELQKVNFLLAFLLGGVIGLVSGLTGTGGGIFLSPLIIFLGWTTIREASGTASIFILCNSLAGLAGNFSTIGHLPPSIFLYSIAVFMGVLIGTHLGIKQLNPDGLRKVLGVVLIIAALKFILT